jgi:hypothetical protein
MNVNDMLQDVRNKFCEEEVNRRREVFLSDINLYLFKKKSLPTGGRGQNPKKGESVCARLLWGALDEI